MRRSLELTPRGTASEAVTTTPAVVTDDESRANRPRRTGASRQRTRRLAFVVIGALVTSGGGWLAGQRVRSPAEIAARRKPPVASPITVPVERRVLSNDLVRRGTLRFDQPTPISMAGPVGSDGDAPATLVTKTMAAGDKIAEGSVLLEVGGRAVIALKGAQPNFRSLQPGASGKDVQQLEEALQRLGIDTGAVDGTYDAATERAVEQLYNDRGYRAQGPTNAEREARRDRRKAVDDAEERVRQATKGRDDATKGPTGADMLALHQEQQQATRGLELAKSNATRNDTEAQASITARQSDLAAATAAEAAASESLARAKAGGTDPNDPTQPCGAVCVTRLVADVSTHHAAANAAADAVRSAQANVDATSKAGTNDVSRAQDSLDLATARVNDATAPKDTTDTTKALEAANAQLDQARLELADLEARTGTSVPVGELIFLPELPLRVDEIKTKVGESASGSFMTVSGSRLAVDSSVEVADVGSVHTGIAVDIKLADLDRHLKGTIVEIGEKPGTKGAGNQQVYVGVQPEDAAAAAELNGASVVVTIPLTSTGGKAVLTVPLAAVTTKIDGTSQVAIVHDGDVPSNVAVKLGLQASGYIEVEPLGGASLSEGDRVIVGRHAEQPGNQ